MNSELQGCKLLQVSMQLWPQLWKNRTSLVRFSMIKAIKHTVIYLQENPEVKINWQSKYKNKQTVINLLLLDTKTLNHQSN